MSLAFDLHARGVGISFDPNCRNPMGADVPPLFERLAAVADLLKLSDGDLRHIYPRQPEREALPRLRARMPGGRSCSTPAADRACTCTWTAAASSRRRSSCR